MPNSSVEERWPRSGSRSKDNSFVISCETLSKVDWYSRRPHKPQLHYYSDNDEEGYGEAKPASEADDEHEGVDDSKAAAQDHGHHEGAYKEGRDLKEKLDTRNGYGEGSSHQRHPFLAPHPPQSVYDKPSVAISSPGRDAKKAERAPRTYPSAIPHTSNLLPHSGILLPNYINIHHAGSHNSGAHVHNKGLASIKAANLIPAQMAGKSSKGRRAFNDAIEPSSPKVNCLGRIKTKHKYCREMGKLADMQAFGLCGDKLPPSTSKKAGVSSSAPPMAKLKKFKHARASDREATTIADPASDSEGKVKMGIRKTLKEAKSHMKLQREKKKSSMASDYGASHAEVAIDLGRFRSMESMQWRESSLLKVSNELHDAGFVSEVPPPNSLLLMRNSKSRAASACTTLTSSVASSRTLEDPLEYGETDVSRQAYVTLFKAGSPKHGPASLADVNVGELEVAANGFEGQGAYFSELDMKRLFAAIADECKPLHGKKNAMAHRQASLPKPTPEARLWQRRCILKPSDIDVGRPIALQVNQPTTR